MKVGIVFQRVEGAAYDIDQAHSEPVKWEVPFPVPVGVGYDVGPVGPGGGELRHGDFGDRSRWMAGCRGATLLDELEIVEGGAMGISPLLVARARAPPPR